MVDVTGEQWVRRLISKIVEELERLRARVGDESFAVFAVDCHPWYGSLSLAMLTSKECDGREWMRDGSEIGEWEYFDFAEDLTGESPLSLLGRRAREKYEQAEDHAKAAVEVFKDIARAVESEEVREALRSFERSQRFTLSVADPDKGTEFVKKADL